MNGRKPKVLDTLGITTAEYMRIIRDELPQARPRSMDSFTSDREPGASGSDEDVVGQNLEEEEEKRRYEKNLASFKRLTLLLARIKMATLRPTA